MTLTGALWFPFSLGVVAAAALLSLFFGGALLRLISPRRGPATPEGWAAAVLIGSGSLMLLFGWMSYAGLAGNRAGPLVIATSLAAACLIHWRCRGLAPFPPRGPSGRPALLLVLCALLGAAIALFPLQRFHAFNPYNDTFTYISISDYLQWHAFSQTADPNPYYPFLTQVRLYQDAGLRMGSTFFLALIQSVFPGHRAVEFYPAAAAWGVALNVFAIFLACRTLLRLPRRFAFAAALLAAATPNPLHYAAANGFVPQLYGTAFFVFALCGLARVARGGGRAAAVCLALGLAFTASAYSELILPALLICALVFGISCLRRGRKIPRLKAGATAGIFALLLVNVEMTRIAKALPVQMHAVVGMHIAYRPLEFLGNALGANPGPWEPGNVHCLWRFPPVIHNLIAVPLGLLALWGLLSLIRRRRAAGLVLLVALLLFAALYFYFALAVANPFIPGATGQSWNLFKLSQWAYPLLLPLLLAGAAALPRAGAILKWLLIISLLLAIPVHRRINRIEAGNAREWTGSAEPFTAYTQLAEAVNRLQPEGAIELRFSPVLAKHRELIVYHLAPRPMVGDWRDDGYLGMMMREENRHLTLDAPHLILTGGKGAGTGNALPAGVAAARSP